MVAWVPRVCVGCASGALGVVPRGVAGWGLTRVVNGCTVRGALRFPLESAWRFLVCLGMQDGDTGDVASPTGHVAMFGKRLVFTDGRGSVHADTFPSRESAREVYSAIHEWYCEWADEDYDDGREDAQARHEWHVRSREAYTGYVFACAIENLGAFGYDSWIVNGRPAGPCGGEAPSGRLG